MDWTKEAFEACVSSRCWWYTPYDAGWDECAQYGADMGADDELRAVCEMERELGGVPDWAGRVVEGPINYVPGCGHYLFPLAYVEAVDAIGSQSPPSFIHGCYTVDRARKERMQDYLLCMDAWLAGANSAAVAAELGRRSGTPARWQRCCTDLWQVLGEQTEAKSIRLERLLHRHRWWVKSMVWDDDRRDLFGRDQFLGDVQCRADTYGNPEFGDPYFTEREAPRVKQLEARAQELCPDGDSYWGNVGESWLCAPKAFRFLERELWSIGQDRAIEPGEDVPAFLQCEDTYPDQQAAAEWWRAFMDALGAWWQDRPAEGEVADDVRARLGERTPVKRWLVRLLVHRLELHEQHADTKRLVRPGPDTKRGTTRPELNGP